MKENRKRLLTEDNDKKVSDLPIEKTSKKRKKIKNEKELNNNGTNIEKSSIKQRKRLSQSLSTDGDEINTVKKPKKMKKSSQK